MSDKYYYDDITQTVGNTPLVKIRKMTAERGITATVLVKPEYFNPTASVKDRMAIYILNEAIKSGELKPGGTIIEATSGNTGAAVAMFAAAHDYKAVLTIPDKMSKEKVDTLKAFGAEVHICPTAVAPDHPDSYYETAKRVAKNHKDVFMLNQYHNLDNIQAHYATTGPEIWQQTKGQIDVFVAGVGTGGTMSGTAKYLKEQKAEIEIVAVDVEGSVYYDYFKTKQLPEAHPYLVEGIGDDMLCETVDFSVIDTMYKVDDKTSFVVGRELAHKEGILAGGSAGSAMHAALEHAAKLDESKVVVVILPDAGAKYITKMFNEEWMREKGFME
ncbi:pyridoxal-phosphate dependent enzyme [candidate division GN15 bacterium]|nr:pyridoxal-phosphate dependent enzyme [candidate division GN15 bacterium]